MLSTNSSEVKGTFQETPLAELLAETAQSKLSGSFRFAHEESKAVVYLNKGYVVYAVSNQRQHRLFALLLQKNQITKEMLREIPEFTNDLAFAKYLVDNNIFTKDSIDELITFQIQEIIKDILVWEKGGWSFSHLARAKDNIQIKLDLTNILLDFARSMPQEKIIKRFRSFEEKFSLREDFTLQKNLFPKEGYIYTRLSQIPVKIQDLIQNTGIAEVEILCTLYVLWIANVISRTHWNSVFTDQKLQDIKSAKLILKKEAEEIKSSQEIKPEKTLEIEKGKIDTESQMPEEINTRNLLEDYLSRVEKAESYYEILDVPIKATVIQIKNAYFTLAKSYHPDKFHQESDSKLQQRVQNAFTEIARAYETLKDTDAREVYNFKLRKYLESIEKGNKVTGEKKAPVTNFDKAREEFDQGFDHLMNENYEEASPFLARAVQLAPEIARYHAYYGKVLSYSDNQRFKAEAEIRQAMKLDPENPTFWIMLAEFYLQFNLLKRAEGELQRLLAQIPDCREAQVLLDSLSNN